MSTITSPLLSSSAKWLLESEFRRVLEAHVEWYQIEYASPEEIGEFLGLLRDLWCYFKCGILEYLQTQEELGMQVNDGKIHDMVEIVNDFVVRSVKARGLAVYFMQTVRDEMEDYNVNILNGVLTHMLNLMNDLFEL
jgi:hypothetical protein